MSDTINKHLGGLFIIPNSTRWNSQYDAFCRVLELNQKKKTEMRVVFTELGLRPMDESELIFLNEFVCVMRPLANALDLLQGENIATAGYLLPTLYTIIEDWEQMTELRFTRPLVAHLTACVRSRFSAELDADYFKITAALHPDFKINWCVRQSEKDDITALVCNALKNYDTTEKQSSTDGAAATNNSAKPPEKRSMFWRMDQRAMELSTADEDDDDTAEVWRRWVRPKFRLDRTIPDILLDPYIDFNTTLPSSAPVERLFSLSKRVLAPTRTLLSDQNFEIMVMCAAAHVKDI